MICVFKQFITHTQVNAHTQTDTLQDYTSLPAALPASPRSTRKTDYHFMCLLLSTFAQTRSRLRNSQLLVQTWQPVDSCGLQSNTGSGKPWLKPIQRPIVVPKVTCGHKETLLFDVPSAKRKFILSSTNQGGCAGCVLGKKYIFPSFQFY